MSTNDRRKKLASLRDEALDRYLNREEFQYDMNADALYRQYADKYRDMGQMAMRDTMGQASALTGGYGSSYAQSVGQQAYNQYLKELGDVVPELYRLAYDRYQDQSEELYRAYEQYDQQEKEESRRQQWQAEQTAEKERWQAQLQDDRDRWQSEYLADMKQWQLEMQMENDHTLSQQRATEEYRKQQLAQEQQRLDQQQRQFALQFALDQQKAQDSKEQFQQEYELKKREQLGNGTGYQDYMGWLSTYQGKGTRPTGTDLSSKIRYDNGKVSTGNVMTMQRVLGQEETGMWTTNDKLAAGGLDADTAWLAYQRGILQLRR